MKAILLTKNGKAETAFETRETPKPEPQSDEIRIKVEAFGLNFADVMARLGMYRDCPPLPAIIGYDVVGHIEAIGNEVKNLNKNLNVGDRVTALTRFGGYAEYAVTKCQAAAKIADTVSVGEAVALSTQYCTAYYCAEEMTRLHPGDHILVHAAAGGVGTALVQWGKHQQCKIFGTASQPKLEYLKKIGVDYPIDYRNEDFAEYIKKQIGDKGLDVIFDPIGGSYLKKGFKLLGSGGRIVTFGASEMTSQNNIFQKLKFAKNFGIYHPVQFIAQSKAMIGVNMLRIADNRPEVFSRVLTKVVELYDQKVFQPTVGKIFSFEQIAEAHNYLADRKSIGKIVVTV